MTDLEALAARVEGAKGPNYALEVEIFKTIHPEYAGYVEGRGGLIHPSDGSDQRVMSDVRPSNYTASLDAAMTLVPEGAGFNLDRYWIREGVRWKVEIATGGIPKDPRHVSDCWDAYTAALATTAAALRARAHLTAGATHDR